ncbi:MAG: HAD-IIIC family phosphatase [Chitinophagaceae bacterium]|nr:MAG: HAD-IIIC family phosphatase [Chitinophagaceae bacterium]
MNNFVFRNYTIEYLFGKEYTLSGYGDINLPLIEYNDYIIFYQINPGASPEQQLKEIEEIKGKIDVLLNMIPSQRRIIIFTLNENYNLDWDTGLRGTLSAQKEFNSLFLPSLHSRRQGIKLIDINSFQPEQKVSSIDWKFFFISQMIINPRLSNEFRHWFNIQLNAIELKRKKCLVLDCDNTLWGGVVGEDGPHGIQLGEDYPGLCFKRFQELIVILASRGVILALCSKNNEQDVFEVWEMNRNNLLNREHISVYRLNWEDKASNIKAISEELNIGLDSMVFIDDNPVERDWVKAKLPEVIVPDFPARPYNLIPFFWKVYNEYFVVEKFSEEDKRKTSQYKENFARNEARKSFNGMEEYLCSLDMSIDIFNASDSNIARIAQMTQKTNQFNLTTKRYTEEQLTVMINNGAKVFCAGVKDKFGDNGITIAGIIQSKDSEANIDSYLLSCRILGRGVENVTLQYLLNRLFLHGIRKVTASYIPTKKNSMASSFYDKAGFIHDKTNRDGTKYYFITLENPIEIKDYYKINYDGTEN